MPTHTITENLQRLTNAKTNIANAITTKGGTVNSGDGFEEFASDIATIPGGVDTSNDTVTAATLKSGYTAHNAAGQQITGSMLSQPTTVTAATLGDGKTAYNASGELIIGTAKLAGNVDLSTDSVTIDSTTTSATVTLSNATGAITITSSGTNYTAQLQNNVITIARTGTFYETGTVVVNVAETQTYGAVQKTITVTSDGTHLCTWADGTDEDVVSMIAAAQAGEIDLTDYWTQGDNRNGLILADGITYTDTSGNARKSIFRILYKIEPSSMSFSKRSKTTTTSNLRYRYYTPSPTYTASNFLGSCRLYFKISQNDISDAGYATTKSVTTRFWYGNSDDILLCDPAVYEYYLNPSLRDSDPAADSTVYTNSTTVVLKVYTAYKKNISATTLTSQTITNNANVSTVDVGRILYCLI